MIPLLQAKDTRAQSDILILRIDCLILAKVGWDSVLRPATAAMLERGIRTITAETTSNRERMPSARLSESAAELGRKVALYIGSAESRATDVPGLTLYRHTAPTLPAPVTYEPSVALVFKAGSKWNLARILSCTTHRDIC